MHMTLAKLIEELQKLVSSPGMGEKEVQVENGNDGGSSTLQLSGSFIVDDETVVICITLPEESE